MTISVGREEIDGRRTYWRLMAQGVLSVSQILVTNAGEVRKLRQTTKAEAHYVRPPRRYALPAITPQDHVSTGRAPRYLRPTPYCDCRAPLVIALARELGAGSLPDRAFAEAAFTFAKEQLTLEIAPIIGVVEVLERGTGTCFELITVFIALCRAAGIPARYKIFSVKMIDVWRSATIDADPLVRKWYDSLGYFLLEGEGEVHLDGEWVVAHVGPTAERQAAAGIPISRLGEDAIGGWFSARPGSIMRLESLPRGLVWGSRLLHAIAPGSMERINVSVQRQIELGSSIIQKAGGVIAYDKQARQQQTDKQKVSAEPDSHLERTETWKS